LGGRLYVQFKNGSGYMYSEVDENTISFAHNCDSIGKFISSQVVKKFPSEKMEKALIIYDVYLNDPGLKLTGEITGFDEALRNAGKTLAVDRKAVVTHVEPGNNQEPEF
jgi:hypothetical protein